MNTSDTLNPSTTKPDYITQVGKNGHYKLSGMAFSDYKIFAIKDEYRDLKYDIGADTYGAPSQIIKLTETDTIFTGMNFYLTKDDTLKPRILSAVMTDKFHVYVTMSEDIDSSVIESGRYRIMDSTANKEIAPLYAYRGKNNADLFLVIRDSIPVENRAVLYANNIKDINKNITQRDIAELIVSDRADTNKPGIAQTIPANRSNTAEITGQEFKFIIGDAFDLNIAEKGINFTDTMKNNIRYNAKKIDDATLVITPDEKLKAGTDYIIKITMNNLKDIAGNYYDSVFTYKFTTITGLDFSGVSGKVVADKTLTNIYLVLQSAAKDGEVYKQRLGESGTFNFDRVKPDKYLLWGFDDADGDGEYSYGKPFPFKTSEKFSYYPDTLNLRARWPVGDVEFKLK
jgi:hypothetical protein